MNGSKQHTTVAIPIEFTETISVKTLTEKLIENPPSIPVETRNVSRHLTTRNDYFGCIILSILVLFIFVPVILYTSGVIKETEFIPLQILFVFFVGSCLCR